MRRLILAAALLAPFPANAQSVSQSQLDAALGTVSRVTTQLASQIAIDQEQIARLQQQLATVTKERDELKAKEPPQK